MTNAEVLADLRVLARKRAQGELSASPLPPAAMQRWIETSNARVTQAHADAAIAWSQRFVFEYGDLIEQMDGESEPDRRTIAKATDRLAWWKRVAAIGGSVGGFYDAVGTRDRLRGFLRGEFDDEIDACLDTFCDEEHARCVVAALAEAMTNRKERAA